MRCGTTKRFVRSLNADWERVGQLTVLSRVWVAFMKWEGNKIVSRMQRRKGMKRVGCRAKGEDVGSWDVSCVPEGSGIFWQERVNGGAKHFTAERLP